MPSSLGDLAERFGCELKGDPDVVIDGVASLANAGPGRVSFLSSPAFKEQLAATRASAVILRAEDATDSPTASLIHSEPYACYARMAAAICPEPEHEPGIHPAASVSQTARIAESACIAANAVVGERSSIGPNTYVGSGSVVGDDCEIGNDCRLVANVTLVRNVALGERCVIHPGTVIGSDGFGYVMTPEGRVKVPQLGGVRIGNDVEIGANTAIDRGAIDDTVIEDGVKMDNQIHIAHNVHIGEHTVILGMCGISGSSRVGKRCMFSGKVGLTDHIEVCDDVIVYGKGMISKSITEPGTYAGNFPIEPVRDWNRRVAQFRRIGKLLDRVAKLEKDAK